MPRLSTQERDEFLNETRYGILTTLRRNGTPTSVPVWYEWTGEVILMFAVSSTPKIKRLRNNPNASLLVVNNLDEKEAWVAFDGAVSITEGNGMALAERLAARYWDLQQPGQAKMLDEWRSAASQIALLELVPEKIRSYKD